MPIIASTPSRPSRKLSPSRSWNRVKTIAAVASATMKTRSRAAMPGRADWSTMGAG
jgi:hypothetical protein